MKTAFEQLQKTRPDGYPIVTEIKSKVLFKSNPKENDYNLPLKNLEKNYNGK